MNAHSAGNWCRASLWIWGCLGYGLIVEDPYIQQRAIKLKIRHFEGRLCHSNLGRPFDAYDIQRPPSHLLGRRSMSLSEYPRVIPISQFGHPLNGDLGAESLTVRIGRWKQTWPCTQQRPNAWARRQGTWIQQPSREAMAHRMGTGKR